MATLIIPVCGKSTRFPNSRPKWTLTHPNGNFMVVQATLGLELKSFDKIYLVALKKHEQQFHFLKGLMENFKEYDIRAKVIFLNKTTKSQPETIYRAIIKEKIRGSIFIKDCDNFFNLRRIDGNCVAYSSLTDSTEINPNNKSYIKINKEGLVENIVEKQIISTTFCCGGYGFERAEEFVQTFKKLQVLQKELYISDIIYDMLIEGKVFSGLKVDTYHDWGDLASWEKYRKNFHCVFSDLDGTLVENSSHHFGEDLGQSKPLQKNIDRLRELSKNGHLYLCITTSRPESYRKITIEQLQRLGIPYNHLIMGLPHCKRVLLNDFGPSNPYPTAVAINLIRDEDDLSNYL